MIASHRHYRSSDQVWLVGCIIFSLGSVTTAFAHDPEGTKRHSLILRPGVEQVHVDQMGTTTLSPSTTAPTGQQPPRRIIENSTTPTTIPTLHRKLTKRPIQPLTPAVSAAQQPYSGANQQTLPQVQTAPVAHAVAGTLTQTTIPNQTTVPFTGVLPTNRVASPTAAAAVTGAQAPPNASSVRPLAAIEIESSSREVGSSSRNGGSRSAMSLFKTPAIMNLLQAPPPPLLTPTSNPPTTPSSPPPPGTPTASQPGSATLSWTLGSESDLAGYKIYVGTSSGNYTYPGSPFTVGRINTYVITNLPSGQTYFFALSAYDSAGNSSPLSGEVSKSIF